MPNVFKIMHQNAWITKCIPKIGFLLTCLFHSFVLCDPRWVTIWQTMAVRIRRGAQGIRFERFSFLQQLISTNWVTRWWMSGFVRNIKIGKLMNCVNIFIWYPTVGHIFTSLVTFYAFIWLPGAVFSGLSCHFVFIGILHPVTHLSQPL